MELVNARCHKAGASWSLLTLGFIKLELLNTRFHKAGASWSLLIPGSIKLELLGPCLHQVLLSRSFLELVNTRWVLHKAVPIHSRNLVAILHLLVALAFHFKAPIMIPEFVIVKVVVVQKKDGMLQTSRVEEEITATNESVAWFHVEQCRAIGGRFERDAFDTLFDHAPDKLNVVKKSLIAFANKHLNKLNLEVLDLDNQFHDGVFFILLMGLLEGYYVPLHCYHMTPTTFEEKVHNVNLALDLMDDAGLPKAKARAEDVVNLDLKSTLRVLYNIFTKYKNVP
nr:beta-parvin-like [Lytechinus pictus]